MKLNLGCGVDLLPGFTNVDNSFTLKDLKSKKGLFCNANVPKDAKFVYGDMRSLPFPDNSAEYVECLEAIEHLPFKDVEKATKEMARVLMPGGVAAIITHDFNDVAEMWLGLVKDKPFNPEVYFRMVQVIYGNQMTDGEFHRAAFTPEYLHGLLRSSGFSKVEVFIHPRGSMPPKFRGAKWPEAPMSTQMIYVEATK